MKPALEHNKTLGILHIVYGLLHIVLGLAMIPLFGLGIGMSAREADAPAAGFFLLFMAIFAIFWLLFSLPSVIAGYGLLKRRRWAKIWTIIAAVIAGPSVPLGTGLCVYSFWFLFSGGGNELYDTNAPAWQPMGRSELYDRTPADTWAPNQYGKSREQTYAPPPQPPNWRGD